MCLLEGEVRVSHVLVEVSFSVLGWTCNEAWKMKQLFAPQWASWLKIQAMSLSLLHIQNQGIFTPLISVPPGLWNMGLWQKACWQKLNKGFLLSQPLWGGGEHSWGLLSASRFPYGSDQVRSWQRVEGSCSCSSQTGFMSNQWCTFCWTAA